MTEQRTLQAPDPPPAPEPQAPEAAPGEVTPASGTPASLAQKLIAARRLVGNVEKAGKNEAQKYDYARAEDVAAAAEAALLEQGLLADFDCIESEHFPTPKPGGMIVKAVCRLIVTDSETGHRIIRQAIGYGSDWPGDKGIYKAQTGARKYAFIHLLGIKLGDDPDETPRGQAAETDSEARPVGKSVAKKLVDRAWQIPAAKDSLVLAVVHVGLEVQEDACSTKAKATDTIAKLTFPQFEKLQRWVEKKESGDAD